MKIKFFVIFLEAAINLINGQQQACSLLTNCLQKVKQQAESCSPLADSIDGNGNGECTEGMTKIKKSQRTLMRF